MMAQSITYQPKPPQRPNLELRGFSFCTVPQDNLSIMSDICVSGLLRP